MKSPQHTTYRSYRRSGPSKTRNPHFARIAIVAACDSDFIVILASVVMPFWHHRAGAKLSRWTQKRKTLSDAPHEETRFRDLSGALEKKITVHVPGCDDCWPRLFGAGDLPFSSMSHAHAQLNGVWPHVHPTPATAVALNISSTLCHISQNHWQKPNSLHLRTVRSFAAALLFLPKHHFAHHTTASDSIITVYYKTENMLQTKNSMVPTRHDPPAL